MVVGAEVVELDLEAVAAPADAEEPGRSKRSTRPSLNSTNWPLRSPMRSSRMPRISVSRPWKAPRMTSSTPAWVTTKPYLRQCSSRRQPPRKVFDSTPRNSTAQNTEYQSER